MHWRTHCLHDFGWETVESDHYKMLVVCLDMERVECEGGLDGGNEEGTLVERSRVKSGVEGLRSSSAMQGAPTIASPADKYPN